MPDTDTKQQDQEPDFWTQDLVRFQRLLRIFLTPTMGRHTIIFSFSMASVPFACFSCERISTGTRGVGSIGQEIYSRSLVT